MRPSQVETFEIWMTFNLTSQCHLWPKSNGADGISIYDFLLISNSNHMPIVKHLTVRIWIFSYSYSEQGFFTNKISCFGQRKAYISLKLLRCFVYWHKPTDRRRKRKKNLPSSTLPRWGKNYLVELSHGLAGVGSLSVLVSLAWWQDTAWNGMCIKI